MYPGVLCQKHLLGEHVEHHMFVGSLIKDINLTEYVKTKLLWPSTLISRHNTLVEEMLRRGMNHKSPLPEFTIDPYLLYLESPLVPKDVVANLNELSRRCLDCRVLQEGTSYV